MKLLVTGATGFLGGAVVAAAREAGREVVGASRRPGVGRVLDLEGPDEALAEACNGFDAVIHAAGTVSHRPENAGWMDRVHHHGARRLAQAARAAGVRRFVHVSSSGTVAVSTEPAPVPDERAPTPIGLVGRWGYYRAKLFGEQEVLALAGDGFEVVSLNPSLLLGPGDEGRATRPVALFLEGRVPAAPPGGLSFADVRDVAAACLAALERGRSGQRYLLGAANWTFADFYARLARVADRPPPAFTLPRATRRVLGWLPGDLLPWGEMRREELELASHFWYLDDRLAREELGWSPRDPVATLEDTVAWLLRPGRGLQGSAKPGSGS